MCGRFVMLHSVECRLLRQWRIHSAWTLSLVQYSVISWRVWWLHVCFGMVPALNVDSTSHEAFSRRGNMSRQHCLRTAWIGNAQARAQNVGAKYICRGLDKRKCCYMLTWYCEKNESNGNAWYQATKPFVPHTYLCESQWSYQSSQEIEPNRDIVCLHEQLIRLPNSIFCIIRFKTGVRSLEKKLKVLGVRILFRMERVTTNSTGTTSNRKRDKAYAPSSIWKQLLPALPQPCFHHLRRPPSSPEVTNTGSRPLWQGHPSQIHQAYL